MREERREEQGTSGGKEGSALCREERRRQRPGGRNSGLWRGVCQGGGMELLLYHRVAPCPAPTLKQPSVKLQVAFSAIRSE